jgi:tetratricopeptide (TPR) repeat protein
MDFIKDLAGEILRVLIGPERWIALIALAVAVVGWLWIGTKHAQKKTLKRQLSFVVILVVLGLGTIAVHHWLFPPIHHFPQESAGILVLRITGDDEKNSAQRDLVNTLDDELKEATPERKIEVRAIQKTVDVAKGLDLAHADARELGRKFNALLVVWGDLVGTSKFHPRITIVREPERQVIGGERTLAAQDISQLNLPVELVTEPVFLAQFCLGYGQYHVNNYRQAIEHFRAAIALKGVSQVELAGTRYFAGKCLLLLSQGQREASGYLTESIDHFRAALIAFNEMHATQPWAVTQNSLGCAYSQLPTGDYAANLQKAIHCYTAALGVLTQAASPQDWASTQNNLGIAYGDLTVGDRAANLQKAIDCYTAALRVLTEAAFPREWASSLGNLGAAYDDLPAGDRAANLQKAIDCYTAGLRVFTEVAFPQDWARTQNNLGNAYRDLPTRDRASNLQKGIDCYTAALRVWTEAAFPQDWATTQNNLGATYGELPTGDRVANLQKAIDCYTAALRVRTIAAFPQGWARTQNNLGNAYSQLPTGDRASNLQKAIDCYTAGLRVRTEAAFPQEWAGTQANLGNAYRLLPTGDRASNLQKAIDCYTAALRVLTEAAFPREWAMTQLDLGSTLSDFAYVTTDTTYLWRARESFANSARGFSAIGMREDAEAASQNQAKVEKMLVIFGVTPNSPDR